MSAAHASAASLFVLIWRKLSTVLGTAATATLMRRAVRAAAIRRPDLGLDGIIVVREDLEYRYALPDEWRTDASSPRAALAFLVRDQLAPLLAELTGPAGVRLLERIPELRREGIVGEGSGS